MPNTIESLGIEINAEARNAYSAIDKLASRLDNLANALGRVESGKSLGELGGNIRLFGDSIRYLWEQTSKPDFNRLSKSINSLTVISPDSLSTVSTAISSMAGALQQLNGVSAEATNIATLASSVSKLGNKGVQRAIDNMPQLAKSLKGLMATLSTAPTVSKNVIDMTNAIANLAGQSRGMGTATKTLNTALKRSGQEMDRQRKKSTSLAASFGKLYASYFLLIRGVKSFFNAIKSTADYLEALNYFDVTMSKISKEWGENSADEFANAFADEVNATLNRMSGLKLDRENGKIVESEMKSLGMSLTEITQYASGIASITNAIGTTGEVSVKTAKAATMLAADLGSLKNVDFSEVSHNIQSALSGQARAMYKYGIDVTNASLATYAYNLGITKSVQEMTQSEKMQLRLLAILDQSKVAWGDLAHTINSPSNMIRQFKTNITELGTVLGQLFIPALEKIMPILNGMTIALKRLFVSFAGILGIKLDLESFSTGYTDALDEIGDSLDETADSADKANKGLRGFDKLNIISSGKGNSDSLKDTLDLTDEITKATLEYERVWNEAYAQMQNKAEGFAQQIEKYFEPIQKAFEKISPDASIGEKIATAIYGSFAEIFDAKPIETTIVTAIGLMKFTGLGSAVSHAISVSEAGKLADTISLAIKSKLATLVLPTFALTGGIALVISGVKAIANNQEMSIGSAITTALGTALTALGTAGAITKIAAIAGGSIAFGSALTLTLPFTLIGVVGYAEWKINQETLANYKETNPFQPIIDRVNDTAKDIIGCNTAWETLNENFSKDFKISMSEYSKIEVIGKRLFELSSNYDKLTDSQKSLVKFYSDELSSLVPGVKENIDEVTGAFKGTREELEALITKQREFYMAQAYGKQLSSATEQYAIQQREFVDAQKVQGEAAQAMSIAYTKLKNASKQYFFDSGEAYLFDGTFEEWFASVEAGVQYTDELDEMFVHYSETLKAWQISQENVQSISNLLKSTESDIQYWENQLGKVSTEGFVSGLEENSEAVQTTITNTVSPSATTKNYVKGACFEFADEISEEIAKGITDNSSVVSEAMVEAYSPSEDAKARIRQAWSDIGLFGGISPNIPNVSSYAGNINSSSIGGASYDIPLAVSSQLKSALGQSKTNQQVVFKVEGDPYNIFKVVQDQSDSYSRRTGSPAFGY